MPDGPDEIAIDELEGGGISLDTDFEEQAEELLELESELSSMAGAEMDPNEQYESGVVIGAERVLFDAVPSTYPIVILSPHALRLNLRLSPDRKTSVYLPWPEQLTGDTPLDQLLSAIDVPAHSFADILGCEIPIERDGSHYVVDLDEPSHGSTANESERTMERSTTAGNEESATTSPDWFYVIIGCYVLWLGVILSIALVDHLLSDISQGVVLIFAWVVLPFGVYYDSKHVEVSSDWSPNKWFWSLTSFIWYVNMIIIPIYLFKRHRTTFHDG